MISLVGLLPPPVGGVSIHLKRFTHYLDVQNVSYKFFDVRKNNLRTLPLKLLLNRTKFIHYHNSEVWAINHFSKFNFLMRNKKKIITLHRQASRLFSRADLSPALNTFDVVVCMNETDRKFLLSHGVTSDVEVISPFIPPYERPTDLLNIPFDFIKSHSPIICANASNLNKFNDVDLYGLDLCVNLCARLKCDNPDIGFIFSLSKNNNPAYLDEINARIDALQIRDNFKILTDPHAFYVILKNSNLFIRPTNTDGDALSVREALYYHVPAIASNASPRPSGTILFNNRNASDLYDKASKIISGVKPPLISLHPENNAEKIAKLYQ
jgi:hypothetical protein